MLTKLHKYHIKKIYSKECPIMFVVDSTIVHPIHFTVTKRTVNRYRNRRKCG